MDQISIFPSYSIFFFVGSRNIATFQAILTVFLSIFILPPAMVCTMRNGASSADKSRMLLVGFWGTDQVPYLRLLCQFQVTMAMASF